jgi:hypothetical protein
MKFNLNVSDANDDVSEEVVDELKDCGIDWDGGRSFPTVNVSFGKNAKNLREVYYEIVSPTGAVLVPRSSFIITHTEGTGKKLAYRLFNVAKS